MGGSERQMLSEVLGAIGESRFLFTLNRGINREWLGLRQDETRSEFLIST